MRSDATLCASHGGESLLRRLLLGQTALDGWREVFAAHVGIEDLTGVTVHDQHEWDSLHSIKPANLGLPGFAIVDLRPGHLLLLGELGELRLEIFLVEADTE